MRAIFVILVFLLLSLNVSTSSEFDVILIPGQGLDKHGEVPSGKAGVDVKDRLHLALYLFEMQEEKPVIIVSGYGKRFLPIKRTEAEVMYEYIKENVSQLGYDPNEYVVKEMSSHQSIENIYFSKKLLDKDSKVLILPAARSFLRVKYISNHFLYDYDISFYSLTTQTVSEVIHDIPVTLFTIAVLQAPTEYGKFLAARGALIIIDKVVNGNIHYDYHYKE